MHPCSKSALRLGAFFLLIGASLPTIAQTPLSCQQLDGAQVFSDEAMGYRYLGFFGTSNGSAPDSIMFTGGTYGDSGNLIDSVRGNGRFGNATECPTEFLALDCEFQVFANGRPDPTYASNDTEATLPPLIVKDRQILGRLTTNPGINPGVSLDWIDSNCKGNSAFASATANGAALPSPVAINASNDGFNIDVTDSGAIRVSWGINNPDFPAATGVQVQVSDTVEGPRTTIQSANMRDLDVIGPNGSVVILGLVPDKGYIVWATLTNAAGTAQLTGSDSGTARYFAAVSPDPVTDIIATPGPERLRFDFDPPEDDGGKPVIRYDYLLIEGSENRICPRTLAQQQVSGDTMSVANPPVIIDGLTGGATYTFCVSACNVDDCGRVGSNELITATAGAPASPPDAPAIERIEFEDGVILIFFSPGADNGAAITRFDASCGEGVVGSGSASPLAVTGAEEGETYDCTLSATNGAGTGTTSLASPITAEILGTGLPLPLLIEALERSN